MATLTASPSLAREILHKKSIHANSDLGEKLKYTANLNEDFVDEVSVNLTSRERAQLLVPSVLALMKDMSSEALNERLTDAEQEALNNWPYESLPDDIYEDVVDDISENLEETLILLDRSDEIVESLENDIEEGGL